MNGPNLSKVNEIADNDIEFRDKLLAIMQKEFHVEKKKFLHAFHQNNNHESAAIVHKLKHKINLLNLEDGYRLATSFENQLLENNTVLFHDFEIILKEIEKFLKSKDL
ncbi:histidine kinase [Tenacibaculum sp. SG-28]|uniref:histidine kinase n=1 Tax=Tenacibaculum sp. SG-28 TaxID=754426 RepID=UPI000CF3C0CD|nr:histidine kinase [Tenacibaculum sp. SG-28]PQJ23411.1 hypothetical protein BSU00_04290 [Tenacibaculum sp. SG-28]